jgi:hypothetical protein
MILKEFDLDLPEKDKNTRHAFRNDVRCIAAHYFSFFPKKFKTSGFWKVLVECVSEDKAPELYMDVKTVKVDFDFDNYLSLEKLDKKKAILDVLHRGVTKVSDEEGWDSSFLDVCKANVIESNYDYYWTYKKPKKNREKKLIAELLCHHDLDTFTATMQIRDLDGETIFEEIVVNEDPNEFVFAYKLGDFKWISNNEIELYNKSKKHVATINVETKNINVIE